MKKIKLNAQRWLSIVLIIAMIFSWFPAPVGAVEVNGNTKSELVEESFNREQESEGEPKDEATSKNEQEIPNVDEIKAEKTKDLKSDKDEDRSASEEKKSKVKSSESGSTQKQTKTDPEIIEEKADLSEEDEAVDRADEIKAKVEKSVEKATQYYKNNPPDYSNNKKGSHSDFWVYSALWGAGIKDLKSDFPWMAEDNTPWADHTYWSLGRESKANMSKEDSGIIIGSIILDKNPYNFGNRNIVEDLIDKQRENGSFSDMFGESWAMIALDLMDAKYDQEEHIEYILSKQNDNGYFGVADATGWNLIALAPHMDRPDVKEAVEKAVQGILDNRDEKTGEVMGQMGEDNSNSVSPIINGLAAVGENLYSEKWTMDTTENGRVNLIESFLDRYQLDDGGFKWKDQDTKVNRMATEQALLALADTVAGESTFVRLKREKKDNLDIKTDVTFRVEGINETLYPEDGFQVETFAENPTAFDATEQALTKADIPYEFRGGYISTIGDEGEASFNGWDGWQFMVNDVYPDVYPNDYPIENDDHIVWYYGNVGDIYQGVDAADEVEKLTLIPEITIPSEIYEEEIIEVKVTSTYDEYDESYNLVKENEKTAIKDALVHFNGKTYPTDKDGIARIPGEKAQVGEYELKVTKDIENSYPRLLRQSKKIIVKEKADPDLDIEGLTDGSTVKDADISFSVSAKDFKGTSLQPIVKLNDKELPEYTGGKYEVTLNKGENTIEIIARDGSRETKRVYNVIYDAQVAQHSITQSIVISEDEVPLPSTEVAVFEGDTAIDALIRIADQHNIPVDIKSYGWAGYVSSIAGVAEFDRGDGSGWMFRVNGKFANVGASDVYLIPGDEVEWLYTLDLGEDLGATELVPIREQMEPLVEIEGLPSKESVRTPELNFTLDSKSYFGTKIDPVVRLNDKVSTLR